MTKLLERLPLLILALVLIGIANPAWAQAWNENRLEWTAPNGCTSGPPTGCPVSSYQIERAATATATSWTLAGTSTTTTFTHTVTTGGQSCYRVIAVAAVGASGPSNVACKTNVEPSGPPNPPTNLRFVTAAVVSGMTVAPVYRVGANGLGSTVFGFVPVGRNCAEFVGRYRGSDFHRVFVRSTAELWGTTDGSNLAAPCRAAS